MNFHAPHDSPMLCVTSPAAAKARRSAISARLNQMVRNRSLYSAFRCQPCVNFDVRLWRIFVRLSQAKTPLKTLGEVCVSAARTSLRKISAKPAPQCDLVQVGA